MKFTFFVTLLFFSLSANAQDYSKIDQFARSVSYSKDYNAKAIELSANFESDEDKARAIFSWLVHYIDYDYNLKEKYERNPRTHFSGKDEADLERIKLKMIDDLINRTMRTRKGVCQEYAYIYQRMCKKVGIPCEFIAGFGRDHPNDIGRVHKKSNHAWNAIKINNEWRLLDLSWTVTMEFEERGENGFFLVDPEVFIMTHFPENSKWQLTRKKYSVEEFSRFPFIYAAWLDYDIESITPSRGLVSKKENTIDFVMKGNPDEYQLMMAVNRVPEILPYEKVGDDYHFSIDVSNIRGDVYIGLLNGETVDPVMSMRVK